MFELKNRVALVTGAAQGIGKEAARALASCGASVWLSDIDETALEQTVGELRSQGLYVSGVVHDVTSPESWQAAIAKIRDAAGRLDVLVNNAGIMRSKPFEETGLEEFRRVMAVNVESVFIGVQAALPLMQETARQSEAGGSIINLSSMYGLIGGNMQSTYCASKGAIRLLSKALAVEFGFTGKNIRVNTVHPGGVDTALARTNMQAVVEAGIASDLSAVESMVNATIPMGRMGRVDDIAGVIAFLASDASKYMSGAELAVDGGASVV